MLLSCLYAGVYEKINCNYSILQKCTENYTKIQYVCSSSENGIDLNKLFSPVLCTCTLLQQSCIIHKLLVSYSVPFLVFDHFDIHLSSEYAP